MPPGHARPSKHEIEKLLKRFHDVPVGTQDTKDDDMILLHSYLMNVKPDLNGALHWFCSRAEAPVVDLAVFLLRLFAYDNEKVAEWKAQIVKVWNSCAECIQSMDRAKVTSTTTYFGAFPQKTLTRFWTAFEAYEVSSIIQTLQANGVMPNANKSLADVPAATVYHILSKLSALKDPFILAMLSSDSFVPRPIAWPIDPPPAGYLLLLFHSDKRVRDWAKEHLKAKAILLDAFISDYEVVSKVALRRLGLIEGTENPVVHGDSVATGFDTFPFVQSKRELWASMALLIYLLPAEKIENYAIHRSVAGHLHDQDIHFSEVLRCMLYILKKLSSRTWMDEAPEYPSIVFDSIKDNPIYDTLILGYNFEAEKPWFLLMFLEFFRSIWDLPIFSSIMAKFAAFTCDDLQHERFKEKRPLMMGVTLQIFSKVISRAIQYNTPSQYQDAINVIDIHSNLIVSIALSRTYEKPDWEVARHSALLLIRIILSSEVDTVADIMTKLFTVGPANESDILNLIIPTFRHQFWKKTYSFMSSKNSEGIGMVIDLAARSATMDKLAKRTVSRNIWKLYAKEKKDPPTHLLEMANSAIGAVGTAVSAMRHGFLDAITNFANANSSSELCTLLEHGSVAKNVIIMMLSPIEDLNVAAQALVSQAYDVDARAEFFREVLKRAPEPAFEGIYNYLSSFSNFAIKLPEAMSAARSLVRCMTDVLEVLGNSPDGLLRDAAFVRKNLGGMLGLKIMLPKLWKAMAAAIAVIFKCCPAWAVYFDNAIMLEWMRDALIFARDLLNHRRVFDAAMLAPNDDFILPSPRKDTTSGKAMVEDLQDVLIELQKWLRLTDTELLYQSLALLKGLFQCFKDADVKPSADALEKLTKFVDANKVPRDGKRVSYLNPADLAELELAITGFDEVVIISSSTRLGKRTMSERGSSPEIMEIEPPTKRVDRPSYVISKSTKPVPKETKRGLASKPSRPALHEGLKQLEVAKTSSARWLHASEPKFEGSSTSGVATPSTVAESSTSESEETDEEERRGLGLLTDYQKKELAKVKKVKTKKPVERRKVKHFEDPAMLRARIDKEARMRKVEEARRNAFRLKPDITPLHRTILSWNYDHEGPDPPGAEKPALLRVPDTFSNHEHYRCVFEPLFKLECWSQIAKSKEETAPEIYECKIRDRSFVSDWLDLNVVITEGVGKDWRLSPDTDIILLRHRAEKTSIMAKVSAFIVQANEIQIALRCCTRALDKDPGLGINSIWRLSLVLSLSTLHREYAALMALPYYDMADVILRPKLSDPMVPGVSDVKQAMQSYQVNEPQAKAILSSMNTSGFSLIQGPPGTGKTWTICGLVGAFLSSRHPPPVPVIAGRKADSSSIQLVQKLLLCAPSNAAIDEVTKRLIEGVRGSQGQKLFPKVVRVGAEAQINVGAKEVSLDTLVTQKLESEGHKDLQGANGEVAALRTELNSLKEERQKKIEEAQSPTINSSKVLQLEGEIRLLNAKRMALSQRLDRLKDNKKAQDRSMDAIRRKYRYEVLAEADVICSTLSGAGHEQLEQFDFPMVIIDEAAQSIELSSLIPLKYRCTQCIMVGDPQQLPPTVLSAEAKEWGYDQSLFVRMQKLRPNAVHLLSIQYRMHPEISRLPSKVFYGGQLQDGPEMAKKTAQPWHAEAKLGIYKFFSATQGREEAARIGHSLINREECKIIAALYDRIRKQFASVNLDYRIGVVSMYRAQVQELRHFFRQRFGAEIAGKVDFNTVDGFQGQEKDIIILSCVRAGPSLNTVGFLADMRRINVAITRSRSSLFVVGHGPTLERSNPTWKFIVEDARERSCLVELSDSSYFTAKEPSQVMIEPRKRTQIMPVGKSSSPRQTPAGRVKDIKNDHSFPKTVKKTPKSPVSKAAPMSHPSLPAKPNFAVGNDNAIAAGRLHLEPTFGKKRVFEGDPIRQQAPGDRSTGQSSLMRVGQAIEAGPPRPYEDRQLPAGGDRTRNAERQAAEKALDAYRRHKKGTNSAFINRR